MLYALAVSLVPLTLGVVAVVAYRAWRRRRPARLWLAAVAIGVQLVASGLGWWDVTYWDGWELDPRVRREELIGTWGFEGHWFRLDADGSFVTDDGLRGAWSWNGEEVSSDVGYFKALKDRGELALLHSSTRHTDPDEWNKYRAMRRRPAASSP